MGPDHVKAFLGHLATERHVAAGTQNQALAALLFLYRHVLDDPLPWLKDVIRAVRPAREREPLDHGDPPREKP